MADKEKGNGVPAELQAIEELETKGTVGGKTPIEIIREMNPGLCIPSGAELAKMISDEEKMQALGGIW